MAEVSLQRGVFSQSVFLVDVGQILHKVVAKISRNLHQHFYVYGVLPEGVVEAGAFHADLLGEPCNGSALVDQFVVDAATDAHVVDGQFEPFASVFAQGRRTGLEKRDVGLVEERLLSHVGERCI